MTKNQNKKYYDTSTFIFYPKSYDMHWARNGGTDNISRDAGVYFLIATPYQIKIF